jgi:hypothetical protein
MNIRDIVDLADMQRDILFRHIQELDNVIKRMNQKVIEGEYSDSLFTEQAIRLTYGKKVRKVQRLNNVALWLRTRSSYEDGDCEIFVEPSISGFGSILIESILIKFTGESIQRNDHPYANIKQTLYSSVFNKTLFAEWVIDTINIDNMKSTRQLFETIIGTVAANVIRDWIKKV